MTRLAGRGQEVFDESEIIPADTGSNVGVLSNFDTAPREEPAEWLMDALSSLERLRSLGKNWDSYGAAPVNPKSVGCGVVFARHIADFVPVLAPVVTATPEGDVGFCWDTGDWSLDLSIDPSERPYGSLFGRRPDLINYGQVGFGRVTTPEAWLSTWSGLSSHADFVRCAPGVTAPTLFLELTGDQAAFPADSLRMVDALGAADLTHRTVRGLHFGAAIAVGEPTGNALAGEEIAAWLGERFATVPPG